MSILSFVKKTAMKSVILSLFLLVAVRGEILGGGSEVGEDYCASNPCGDGNTCFSTPVGHKCFCKPGDYSYECVQEEQCLLYNHTGTCREDCHDDETGFFMSHLGGKLMDLKIYNKDGNVTVKDHVPIVDIKEQAPCMWQLSGKPNCCVRTKDVKIGCFAYGRKVRVEGKGVISIEDVRTGDRLEAIDSDGKPLFSDVIMIMHQEPDRVEEMVQITTSPSGYDIVLTHDHLVYVSDDGDNWRYLFSEKAVPGQFIKVFNSDREINVEQITGISRSQHKGLYAPVTMTGTITVDNIVASCYGNHPDHFLSHTVFAPIRWSYKWVPWIYDGDSVTSDGSHPFVSFLNRYLRALTGHSLVLTQHRLDGMTNYL